MSLHLQLFEDLPQGVEPREGHRRHQARDGQGLNGP